MTSHSVPPLGALPELVGVIHLKPLPGSPRFGGDISAAAVACGRDAEILADAGFDAIIIENYGDAPFEPRSVGPVTVAAMTRCALAARVAAPMLPLGINVLRNDAEAALAVAVAAGGAFIRVNVHTGARLTDQGLVEGAAHRTLRARRALGASHVKLFCDVDVKHSAPLAPRPVGEEAHDLVDRGGADAVLVTGSGTGKEVALRDLDEVLRSVAAPVYVASGVTEATLPSLRRAHGLIVGSCLRSDGRAGGPIDAALARRFVEVFRAIRAAQAEGRTESAPPPSVAPAGLAPTET